MEIETFAHCRKKMWKAKAQIGGQSARQTARGGTRDDLHAGGVAAMSNSALSSSSSFNTSFMAAIQAARSDRSDSGSDS
jgi:hypothetical protein